MATHDYVIANQGFPAFRSDLNDVLQAIVSNNSNATAPSTTYAYQMWYETDTNNWYMRNADNDAWITLATFNQTNDTVNFIDSSTTVAGISTSASATVLTLADGSVAINPAGFVSVGGAATQSGEVRFLEDTDNGSNYIALKPASAISSNSTLTLPEATDTLVGKATTDTLTNKTLTSPKINEDVVVTSTATELNKLDAVSRGSIIYGNASAATAILTKGGAGTVLTSDGTDIAWSSPAGGGTDWQSSIVTASTLTAVAGRGYWINTTSNACTVTLPGSASVGDQIIFSDYLRTWGTNAITINQNSLKFQGNTSPNPEYDTNGESVDIIYSGATQGWIPNTDGAVALETPQTKTVNFLVIAGGGGGASSAGGAGGAGGYRASFNSEASGGGGSSETALELTAGTVYTVTVGAGGGGGSSGGNNGTTGSNSSISGTGITTITSSGGGGGGNGGGGADGIAGGSGGGGAGTTSGTAKSGGSGTANQGFDGGDGFVNNPQNGGGGGGGAGAVGVNGSANAGGNGGVGVASTITASSVTRAGGGGGSGKDNLPGGSGGTGGGGVGNTGSNGTPGVGSTNTGSGGGGSHDNNAAAGGSGVVILRVATSEYSGTSSGSPTISTSGSDTILVFNGDGSYTG